MQLKVFLKLICFGIVLCVLDGCSKQKWYRDRSDDYQKAEILPTLKVPASMHSEPFNDDYQIPGLKTK